MLCHLPHEEAFTKWAKTKWELVFWMLFLLVTELQHSHSSGQDSSGQDPGSGGVMVQWLESLYILKEKDCSQPPLERVTSPYFSHNCICLGLETLSL